MRKFTADGYRSMPWKNGGGVTTELAIEPRGATLDDFDWRISTARVETAGPFSHFEEIDRSLAVLNGGGLILRGESNITLTPQTAPFAFRGEQPLHAELADGPITDFNVMTRRTRWTHRLERVQLNGAKRFARHSHQLFIFCAAGTHILCRAGRQFLDLDVGEALLIDSTDGSEFELAAPAPSVLYLAHLTYRETANAQ